MWYKYAVDQTLSFTDEVTNAYSGQTNHMLVAKTPNDEVAGYIEYVVYMGEPSISMITVPENMRRKGYGKALVRQLQSIFPDQEIQWGGMTDDGSALHDSLSYKDMPTRYNKMFDIYESAKKEFAELQAVADNYYDQESHTPEEKAQFEIAMDRWSVLHDRIWKLEQMLDGEKPHNRIIN